MTHKEIAQEWLDAQKIRQEARELSNESLAKSLKAGRPLHENPNRL